MGGADNKGIKLGLSMPMADEKWEIYDALPAKIGRIRLTRYPPAMTPKETRGAAQVTAAKGVG